MAQQDDNTQVSGSDLTAKYRLHMEQPIERFHTPFAKAYRVDDVKGNNSTDSIYALVFDNGFPPRLDAIRKFKRQEPPNIVAVLDAGKMALPTTKAERFVAIFEQPVGIPLSQYIRENGAMEESLLITRILQQLIIALSALTNLEVVHGTVNLDTIFYDKETGKITLSQCFGEFCGMSQKPAFESLDRLLAHSIARGYSDLVADYYALGMVILSLLAGKEPFTELTGDLLTNVRLENGSYESAIAFLHAKEEIHISKRLEGLLRGLLAESTYERWGADEVRLWAKKADPTTTFSKLHRQAISSFQFNEKDYFSTKYLAHDIYRHWNVAKRNLKIADLARWVRLVLKRTDIAETLERISAGESEVILPDDKITRTISTLDPSGPIRYKSISAHVFGVGGLLAHSIMNGEGEQVQEIAELLDTGLIDHWINLQSDAKVYTPRILGWASGKVRLLIRRPGFGFGIERAMYDMNRTLPCQSKWVGNKYALSLDEVLLALDASAPQANYDEDDPVDRHAGGFIGAKLNLQDDVRIKNIQAFPEICRNPQLLMLGLLTMAEMETNIGAVNNLSIWLETRLEMLLKLLHSRTIRKSLKEKLREAAKKGSIKALFDVASNSRYIRSDMAGFNDARRQYRRLMIEIMNLKKKSNIQSLAYQYGLRISVTISYLICVGTLMYVLFRTSINL